MPSPDTRVSHFDGPFKEGEPDKIGWKFAGQGSQEVGMGRNHFYHVPQVRRLFIEADQQLREEGLQRSILDVMFEGPKEDLERTEYSQPAIVLNQKGSLVALEVHHDKHIRQRPDILAGNSLGEITALHVADAIPNFRDVIKLVRVRSREMQKACDKKDSKMWASQPLTEEQIEELRKKGIYVCLYNSEKQYVIGGAVEDYLRVQEEGWFKQNKIRTTELSVAGAYHSPLMEPAIEEYSKVLDEIDIQDAHTPVFANILARPIQSAKDTREELRRQPTEPVRWDKTTGHFKANQVKTRLEIGNKPVLTNMQIKVAGGVLAGAVAIAGATAAYLWHESQEE